MAISQTFDSGYPQNPWAQVSTKTLENYYVPALREYYVTRSIYSRFSVPQFSFAGLGANQATITRLIPPHPNFNEIGARQLWLETSYMDSEARVINFGHYGRKMSLHEYDDLITYWRQDNRRGLVNIINRGLGENIVGVMDLLARNAMLGSFFKLHGNGSPSSFNGITTSMKFSTDIINGTHLAMAYREVPYASNPDGMYQDIVCITSFGAAHDLMNEIDDTANNGKGFVPVQKYADPRKIIRNEIGTYRNVRLVRSPRATLWNCGEIDVQYAVIEPIHVGDGSPTDQVFGTFVVGQPDATHYIQLENFAEGDFRVGDIVTIHRNRTSDNGITNGVDFRDGMAHNRVVVSVDHTNNRLAFDKPILEDFTTDLGSSVYAYVTKGRHIHTAVFIGGDDAIVQGVLRPISIRTPRPVDDHEELYRISWKGDFGYSLFEPKSLQVWFGAGTTAFMGVPEVT